MSKILHTPTVEINTEQAKLLAQVICQEIKESRDSNKKLYQRARRCENQYNQVTQWQAMNKVCDNPWDGAVDYYIPLTEWIIDAVHARVMNILFSQEPYMTASGVEASDVDKAPGVTDFLDTAFREIIKLRENTEFFFKQKIKLPFAIMKYPWVYETEPRIVKETAMVFVKGTKKEYLLPNEEDFQVEVAKLVEKGYQPTQETEEVWALDNSREIVNAPQLQYIRFEDYVWAANAKRGTRLYWEGDRFWNTIDEIRVKETNEIYVKGSTDLVKSALKDTEKRGKDQALAIRKMLIEEYDWWGRVPFNKQNQVDMTGDDTIEQECHIVVSFKEEVLMQIEVWPYARIPDPERVYIRGVYEETENWEGRSLAEKLYMTNKELNTLHNTLMNNGMLAMQKIFVKKRHLAGDKYDRPELYPGAMLEEDTQGDIRVLEVGDVNSIGIQLEGMMINYAERVSNISQWSTGTAAEQGQEKTKGEVVATIQEGNIGMNSFIQRCHSIMRTICKWTVSYYSESMPPNLERRIRGDSGDLVFADVNKGENQYWEGDDLTGKFDYKWNGTALTADKKLQIAISNDLHDRYLVHPMVAGNLLAVWQILKDGLLARGKKDWQKILPPREAIVAEMERLDMEAKARQKSQQGAQQLPGAIIKKLVGKGMSRSQAQAAVAEKLRQGESAMPAARGGKAEGRGFGQ